MFIQIFLSLQVKQSVIISHKHGTQLARNIAGIFAQCSLSVAMFGTSRKHLRTF